MRITTVGFYLTLGLGALGLTAGGCGQLWRPFLDPEVVVNSDLAVADLATPADLTAPGPGGPQWSLEPSFTTQTLYGVWGTNYSYVVATLVDAGAPIVTTINQTPVFAVGAAGTLLQRSPTSQVWSVGRLDNPASPNLYAVTGRSATEVMAVGDGQVVALWNGMAWSSGQGSGASGGAFFGVAPLMGQNGYVAVGASGLLNIVAGMLRSVPVGYAQPQVDLTGAYASGAQVWVGTARGDLIKYDQGMVTTTGLAPGNALRAIWASSASDIWAVGDSGSVLRYDGTTWSSSTTRFPALRLGLHGVTGNAHGEVWIVGDNGTILYFNGSQWSVWQHPSLSTLRSVFREPVSGGLWAVGDQGIILHAVAK